MPADAFIGDIMMFGGNFAPIGWMKCEGQILPISGNESLFAVIGATYGGDGQVTFALPDMRGRCIIGFGTGSNLTPRTQGDAVGEEQTTLSVANLPSHTHSLACTSANGDASSVASRVPAASESANYRFPSSIEVSSPAATSTAGGGAPHPNMQPFLALTICICAEGIFPPFP